MILGTSNIEVRRLRLLVHGIVQGVGFRPFVYRLANDLRLSGWVENTPQGVAIEVEGPLDCLEEFSSRLASDKPELATVNTCESFVLDPCGLASFEIRLSKPGGEKTALVLPDIATCHDCLCDIVDPTNRRYRYPFTNCTNCGPRFSIIESLPYDRANTSMKRFAMCDQCRHEYDDPTNRRFHAQPNACAECGPHVALWDVAGRESCARNDALLAAAKAVCEGRILALIGLGVFQLLVDARRVDAVAELRRRKQREEKPFAVMVSSVVEAETLCHVGDVDSRLLESPQAPIVLLRRRGDTRELISPNVTPRNPYLGVMLPYTPLHHLLMRELGFPLVATSGNLSDEPICTDEHEAVTRLREIADVFLVHDRPIVRHVDDSVVRVIRRREMVVRRARGYAPLPVQTASKAEPILSVGAHQKNAVALASNGQVFISQHIGDLVTREAFEAFDRATIDLPALYEASPRVVACDLHPDYLSTKHAENMGCKIVRVQHHHAHIASCMAENDLEGTVLGVSWDGSGYGPDGTVWGGEFLRCNCTEFERVAHLRHFPLPGGDLAAREPCRSALGLLYEIYGEAVFERSGLSPITAFNKSELQVLRGVLRKRVNCPSTSSVGRLFDAVASILDIRQCVHYEGQGAMELEFAAAELDTCDAYPFSVRRIVVQSTDVDAASNINSGPAIIDWNETITSLMEDVHRGTAVAAVARKFHNTLVDMIVAVAKRFDADRVMLSGGCFQNQLLLERTIARLETEGFRPYWHHRVPPNDGGISLGQAVVAQHRIKESRSCA